jgi:hypothetical protein
MIPASGVFTRLDSVVYREEMKMKVKVRLDVMKFGSRCRCEAADWNASTGFNGTATDVRTNSPLISPQRELPRKAPNLCSRPKSRHYLPHERIRIIDNESPPVR